LLADRRAAIHKLDRRLPPEATVVPDHLSHYDDDCGAALLIVLAVPKGSWQTLR